MGSQVDDKTATHAKFRLHDNDLILTCVNARIYLTTRAVLLPRIFGTRDHSKKKAIIGKTIN